MVIYRIEGLLQVNEDRLCKKTVIHISADFIHEKGDSCFSGEILPKTRLTRRQKIVSIQITEQLMVNYFLSDFRNHWKDGNWTIVIHFFPVARVE